MTSSDSGEDFESADEGIDFEETSLRSEIRSKRVCSDGEMIKQAECQETSRESKTSKVSGDGDVMKQAECQEMNVESKTSKVSGDGEVMKQAECQETSIESKTSKVSGDGEVIQQDKCEETSVESKTSKVSGDGEVIQQAKCQETSIESKTSKVSGDGEVMKQAKCEETKTETVNHRLNNINLETLPQTKHDFSENQDIRSSLLNVENHEKTKSKAPKKLGTKLTSTKTDGSHLVCAENLKKDAQEEDKKKVSLNANTAKVQCTELTRPENVNNISGTMKKGKNPESSISNVSKTNDGWDFEEEDGFSITSTLSKASSQFKTDDQQEITWSRWGGWGMTSLLSTATDSVSTFSSQVSAGLSTVLETTVGAPDPETLAASTSVIQESHKVEEETSQREDEKPTGGYVGLGSLVSGVSMLGSSVINRGLDTLESLGKKTMEVLQEGDPGLKKKRAMLFADQDKPVLSQILREAKEKAECSDKEKEEKELARKAHFESLFDDFQGMVHLEALEMLSTQCELKLQSLLLSESGSALDDLEETLSQVQDLCELPDDEDESEGLSTEQFNKQVSDCVGNLKIQFSSVKITKANDAVIARLCGESSTEVHQNAISSLAEFTAAAMECFHKSAELLMAKTFHNTADEAECYTELTSLLCAQVSVIANEFTQLLTKDQPIANSSLITNIFLEASNSCSYIKNACKLLVPILQLGALS